MKIERINENQIRCILTKSDLLERHIKISELAYGSEKAKELFRDMMEQASMDFGFDADDIPLMIEAIPASRDSIVLVITKVEDPKEFERRFAQFSSDDDDEDDDDMDIEYEVSDEGEIYDSEELIDCFDQFSDIMDSLDSEESDPKEAKFIPLHETLQPNKKRKKTGKKKEIASAMDGINVFSFSKLDDIIEAAHTLGDRYQGKNSLWKDELNRRYYLYMISPAKSTDYEKVCDIVGEFGKPEFVTYATKAYFEEHYTIIVRDRALLTLSIM